jgi:hypothetical protein
MLLITFFRQYLTVNTTTTGKEACAASHVTMSDNDNDNDNGNGNGNQQLLKYTTTCMLR